MEALRERQKAARRDAIVTAAAAIVLERGPDALHPHEVAARAGTSTATLYNLMGGMNEVISAVVLRIGPVIERIAATHSDLPPLLRCTAWTRAAIEVFAEERARTLPALQLYLKRRSTADWQAARPLASLAELGVGKLRDAIEEAQRAGEFDRGLEARMVAESAFVMLKHSLDGWAGGQLSPAQGAVLAERGTALVLLAGASTAARAPLLALVATPQGG